MGTAIALLIFMFWGGNLYYALNYVAVDFSSPLLYLPILIQTFLFTGLFITSHEARHRTVSNSKWFNNSIGFTSPLLYVGMWYPKLLKNHHLHHESPGTPWWKLYRTKQKSAE